MFYVEDSFYEKMGGGYDCASRVYGMSHNVDDGRIWSRRSQLLKEGDFDGAAQCANIGYSNALRSVMSSVPYYGHSEEIRTGVVMSTRNVKPASWMVDEFYGYTEEFLNTPDPNTFLDLDFGEGGDDSSDDSDALYVERECCVELEYGGVVDEAPVVGVDSVVDCTEKGGQSSVEQYSSEVGVLYVDPVTHLGCVDSAGQRVRDWSLSSNLIETLASVVPIKGCIDDLREIDRLNAVSLGCLSSFQFDIDVGRELVLSYCREKSIDEIQMLHPVNLLASLLVNGIQIRVLNRSWRDYVSALFFSLTGVLSRGSCEYGNGGNVRPWLDKMLCRVYDCHEYLVNGHIEKSFICDLMDRSNCYKAFDVWWINGLFYVRYDYSRLPVSFLYESYTKDFSFDKGYSSCVVGPPTIDRILWLAEWQYGWNSYADGVLFDGNKKDFSCHLADEDGQNAVDWGWLDEFALCNGRVDVYRFTVVRVRSMIGWMRCKEGIGIEDPLVGGEWFYAVELFQNGKCRTMLARVGRNVLLHMICVMWDQYPGERIMAQYIFGSVERGVKLFSVCGSAVSENNFDMVI